MAGLFEHFAGRPKDVRARAEDRLRAGLEERVVIRGRPEKLVLVGQEIDTAHRLRWLSPRLCGFAPGSLFSRKLPPDPLHDLIDIHLRKICTFWG